MIYGFKFMEGDPKTKSRLECRHRILGRATKKGIGRNLLIPLNYFGDPNGVRTRVAGVRGRSPRPLDDGAL